MFVEEEKMYGYEGQGRRVKHVDRFAFPEGKTKDAPCKMEVRISSGTIHVVTWGVPDYRTCWSNYIYYDGEADPLFAMAAAFVHGDDLALLALLDYIEESGRYSHVRNFRPARRFCELAQQRHPF